MSKAFTREDDDAAAVVVPPAPRSSVAGARSPITRAGHRRLSAALEDAATRRDAPLAARLHALLERVEPWPASEEPADVLAFGRGARVRDGTGQVRTLWVVGVEEADPAAGRVSRASPLGQALLGARRGDVVDVTTPRGEDELEVLEVLPEAD